MTSYLGWHSHDLNQCWNIVNWTLRNKRQWTLNPNLCILFKKMHLKMSSGKWRQSCLGFNVLTVNPAYGYSLPSTHPYTYPSTQTLAFDSKDKLGEWLAVHFRKAISKHSQTSQGRPCAVCPCLVVSRADEITVRTSVSLTTVSAVISMLPRCCPCCRLILNI